MLLKQMGLQVLLAENGMEALDVLRTHGATVRLLLTDLMMPRMGGISLLREARRLAPHVAVIATTGLYDSTEIQQLAPLGVNEILRKPFTSDDMMKAVKRCLEGARR